MGAGPPATADTALAAVTRQPGRTHRGARTTGSRGTPGATEAALAARAGCAGDVDARNPGTALNWSSTNSLNELAGMKLRGAF